MKAETEKESKDKALLWACVIGLGALVLTLLIGRALERRHLHRLPHSGVGVFIGAVCAGVVRWVAASSASRVDDDVLKDEQFDYEVFMVFLLPPIIFEAGFNIDAPSTMRNLGPTVFFAFVGTTFSTFVVGGLVYLAGVLGLCYPLGLLASLTFGSLISATDPVSVLSVFKAIGVREDIFAVVFGESVLNDAVAIVLTRTLLSFREASSTPILGRVAYAACLFVFEFASSLLLGAGFGVGSSVLLRVLDMRAQQDEEAMLLPVALCFAFAWGTRLGG